MNLRSMSPARTALFLSLLSAGIRSVGQSPCPDSLVLPIISQQVGPLEYAVQAGPGQHIDSFVATQWEYADQGPVYNGLQPTILFPEEGTYLVCVSGMVTTDQQSNCELTACDLVVASAVAPGCADAGLDITAEPQSQQVLWFQAHSSIGTASAFTYFWDFGDGNTSTLQDPTHTFAPGAYRICVTATLEQCVYTTCEWLYLGPGSQPCSALFEPGIRVESIGRTIAAYNTSHTSGMIGGTTWDLGDGNSASGEVIMHTYASADPWYTVCADLWVHGAAVVDTCTAELCTQAFEASLGVSDDRGSFLGWVRPTLFSEELLFGSEQAAGRTSWWLLDVAGRVVSAGSLSGSEQGRIRGSILAPGPYILHLVNDQGRWSGRVLKR